MRATYISACGRRFQLTVLKAFLTSKSSEPKSAVIFEALLEQPASLSNSA